MRLTYFGGPAWDAGVLPVRGRGQEAVLFRLAMDAGSVVGYRALAEDVWPIDPPVDARAALQSLVSRLRRALPDGLLEAVSGGYRLALTRDEVDLTRFQDLVARARRDEDAVIAREALTLWTGDPWVPADVDWVLRDLLEDRAHAERLVRAAAPDGAAAHPQAPSSAPSSAQTLSPQSPSAPTPPPVPLTSLVGRLDELGLIARQLDAERLVTLIGAGGAGKTTLALETARRHPGAVLVELAPAGDGQVWSAIAGAVARSIRFDTSTAPAGARERALEALAGRTVLIVLDNCEHVSLEAAGVARDLLGNVPGARLLATSREPLGLPGEAFVDLGPLPERDAVELFSRRVRAASGAAPADDDLVTRIARRLDGLPLALELAAAKTRTLSLTEIDTGLDDRFALLATGPRAADPRHQTLRALIDWSWETLTALERTALLALSVFPDGLLAADAVTVGAEFGTEPVAFDQLVERSLARRQDSRFRMLETVREYGLDRLRSAGDDVDFAARRARALADRALAHDALLRGPRVREGLAWFIANEENLTAALRTVLDVPELHSTGVRLTRGAMWAWLMRERFEELRMSLTGLARPDAVPTSEPDVVVQAVALLLTTMMAVGASEDPPSPLALDTDQFAARTDRLIAAAAAHPSELSAVVPPLLTAVRETLRVLRPGLPWTYGFSVGPPAPDAPTWTIALLAMLRSAIAQNSGDVQTLGAESERALRLFRQLGDVWGTAFSSQMRAEWLLLQGRLEEALAVADASTQGLTGLTSTSDLLQQRSQALNALVRMGRWDEARERLTEILALAETDGSERARFHAAFAAASIDVAAGDGAAALRRLDAPGAATPLDEGPPQIRAWDASIRARAHLLLGETDLAGELLHEGIAPALRGGDQPILADAAVTLAWWLCETGRLDDAHSAAAASAVVRGAVDTTDPAWQRLRARLPALDDITVGGGAYDPAAIDAAIAILERLAP